MELTFSFETALPRSILDRYEIREVRNAAAMLAAAAPQELADLIDVLEGFRLTRDDLVNPGGQKSDVASRLDAAFRERGWREGRHDLTIVSKVTLMPWKFAGERDPEVSTSTQEAAGYKVDNLKGRIAIDGEWNAKDGNLHRDLTAYRVFYEQGIIDAAVIITRTLDDLRELQASFGPYRGLGCKYASEGSLCAIDESVERGPAILKHHWWSRTCSCSVSSVRQFSCCTAILFEHVVNVPEGSSSITMQGATT